MKHFFVVTLLLLCVLPVFMWPMEESWHPLPVALVEEGFEVAGRHRRAVHSSPTTVATNRRTTSSQSSAPAHRKGSIPHQSGKKPTPAHHSQPENRRKARENRPTKPGKKLVLHHHQQKSHKKSNETKVH
ncbi:hypothetical protein GHT06_012933 [Daphnia sinensis]|uniref:Secreted protein n=1 Tax=Daphnia sinensis TaxID=1820382 RepID=A0AAD5LFW3_9CRUS|nr:hypothetical protein GHT06_012933 [Daphnia sinensis]